MRTPEQVAAFVNVRKRYDEPPVELFRLYKNYAYGILQEVGIMINDRDTAGEVCEFMARLHLSRLDTRNRAAKADPESLLSKYGIADKSFEPPRGLLLYGPPGTGKTTIARVIGAAFGIDIFPMYELTTRFCGRDGSEWWADFLTKHERKAVILDDIGTEDKAKSYGRDFPILDLFHARAVSFEWHGAPTVYTSNIGKLSEFKAMYDDRVEDRIAGSCVEVLIGGKSHRRQR